MCDFEFRALKFELIQAAAPDTNVAGRWGNEKRDLVVWLDPAILCDGWLSYQQYDDFCDMLPSSLVYSLDIWRIVVHFDLSGVLLVDWTLQLRHVGDRIKKATEKVGPSVRFRSSRFPLKTKNGKNDLESFGAFFRINSEWKFCIWGLCLCTDLIRWSKQKRQPPLGNQGNPASLKTARTRSWLNMAKCLAHFFF